MNIADTSSAAHELAWFKSSYSGAEGGDCVQVAVAPTSAHVRDSKVTAGPTLTVAPQAWAGFLGITVRQSD